MADIPPQEIDPRKKNGPDSMDWRRTLLGFGGLTLIAALFAGGASHTGVVPKLLGTAGLLMVVIGVVAIVVERITSKARG
jgi:uncharacterized membrane protein YuzA (DUF378 family)